MGERKVTLKIPKAYEQLVEDIRQLKSDEENPNKMTIKQKEQTWKEFTEGWLGLPDISSFLWDTLDATHHCAANTAVT